VNWVLSLSKLVRLNQALTLHPEQSRAGRSLASFAYQRTGSRPGNGRPRPTLSISQQFLPDQSPLARYSKRYRATDKRIQFVTLVVRDHDSIRSAVIRDFHHLTIENPKNGIRQYPVLTDGKIAHQ